MPPSAKRRQNFSSKLLVSIRPPSPDWRYRLYCPSSICWQMHNSRSSSMTGIQGIDLSGYLLPVRPRRKHPVRLLRRNRRRLPPGVPSKAATTRCHQLQVNTVVFRQDGYADQRRTFDVQSRQAQPGVTGREVDAACRLGRAKQYAPIAKVHRKLCQTNRDIELIATTDCYGDC